MNTFDIDHAKTIPGWMSDDELAWLATVAAGVPRNKMIVEIGSWLGRSTAALAANASLDTKILAVDTWKGSPSEIGGAHKLAVEKDLYTACQENLGRYKNIIFFRGTSAAASCYGVQPFMTFIDGEHTFEAVLNDIRLWEPKTRGIICGHDYSSGFPGVIHAVRGYFGDRRMKVLHPAGSIWAVWKELGEE